MRKKPLVFIVEDDDVLAKIITWELEDKCNCQVRSYGSGESMVVNFDESPDIVIIDYFLPGMNGGDVLEYIKSEASSAKVIGVSGQLQLNEVKEFFNAGLEVAIEKDTDFLQKISKSVLSFIDEVKEEEDELAVEFDDQLDKKIVVSGVLGLVAILVLLMFNFFDFL